MNIKSKPIITLFLFVILIFNVSVNTKAFSDEKTAIDIFGSSDRGLLCVSYRGDTSSYPENSLEAVKSAFELGADFVSVSIDKTKDGVFYLCEKESLGNICNAPYNSLSEVNSEEIDSYNLFDIYGNLTGYKITSLEALIKETDSKHRIILDINPEDMDSVYDFLSENGVFDRILIRVNESAGKLVKWSESKPERVGVIAVYSGNVIFNTIKTINEMTLSGMPAVQYQSKNYFNVAYGEFFTSRYLTTENASAVAATYSPDLCGQRRDSADGWNELIKKGYSVIETNNIESFIAYREETERLSTEISRLLDKAFYVDAGKYSEISLLNLENARLNAETLLSGRVFSLDEAQYAYSRLLFALEDMKISTGEVDTRGALNITPGKVIATLLVGTAFLASQIYLKKMRKK